VTAPAPPGLGAALQRAAQPFDDAQVRLRVVASSVACRHALEADEIDALLLLSTERLVFRNDVDPKAVAVAETAVRQPRNHLPVEPELTASTLHAPEKESSDAAILVAAFDAPASLGGNLALVIPSTRSSGWPGACTRTASSTPGLAWACAPPGASPARTEGRGQA